MIGMITDIDGNINDVFQFIFQSCIDVYFQIKIVAKEIQIFVEI